MCKPKYLSKCIKYRVTKSIKMLRSSVQFNKQLYVMCRRQAIIVRTEES